MFRKTFTHPLTGKPLVEGDLVKRPILAETLRKIAENGTADVLYRGPIGEKLIEEIQARGGIMTMEDLNNYKVVWEEPAETFLSNGFKLYSSPPPGSGSIVEGILTFLDSLMTNNHTDDLLTNMQR